MLGFYQRWALRLAPTRQLFLLLSLCSIATFVWLLFAGAELSSRWQLPVLSAAILCAVLWLWSKLFVNELPVVVSSAPFLQRCRQRLNLFGLYLLALLFSAILLVSLYLGLRALKGIIIPLFF